MNGSLSLRAFLLKTCLFLVAAAPAGATAIPLVFEANVGQTGPQVRYLARVPKGTLWLTAKGAVLATGARLLRIGFEDAGHGPASHAPQIRGEEKMTGKANYFVGSDSSKWHTGIPLFGKVRYCGVWPGIDAVFYGNDGNLEFDLALAPGADPSRIRLRYHGAAHIAVEPTGDLLLTVSGAIIRQHAPRIYQGGRYVLAGRNRVRFALGPYDHSQPLVIDPVLTFGTYLGGSNYDGAYAVAMDPQGNVIVAGETDSGDFPTANRLFSNSSGQAAFVTKLNPSATTPQNAIVFSTYVAGAQGGTYAASVALDSTQNVYITGVTNANDYPVTPGVVQGQPQTTTCEVFTTSSGSQTYCATGFVTKLTPAGDHLTYSTFLGGEGYDVPLAITVDSQGSAYIAGQTYSTGFPTTSNGYQRQQHGNSNAFLSEISPDATRLLYSTYFGGEQNDLIKGIAVDRNGIVYTGGQASSQKFPTTPGAFSASRQGPKNDGFLAKFDLGQLGTASLLYSSYIGGAGGDSSVNGIAVDGSGNIAATGTTNSGSFPVTAAAFQPKFGSAAKNASANANYGDAFVLKLNPTAQGAAQLMYSSYLGGEYVDIGNAIAMDSTGRVVVAGQTTSDDFPLTPDAFQVEPLYYRGFVARVDMSKAGTAGLLNSTLLGGTSQDADILYGIAVSNDGNIAATAGSVSSTDMRITASNAPQPTAHGQGDAYVAVLNFVPPPPPAPTGPQITAAFNAASFQSGKFSPGMIFSIQGTGLGPQTPLTLTLDSNGRVSTALGGAQVLVGGLPAPILYASATQINAVVPYELDPSKTGTASVQAVLNGVSGNPFPVAVVPADPGIFELSAAGQGAILNQDFSVNGAGNPAAKGSYISIYATGEGQTNPAVADGHISNEGVAALARPVAPVSVSIGGVPVASSDIAYAGAAPGSVAGLFQVTVQVPSNIPSGSNAVVITIGAGSAAAGSQNGVTVAVQ